MSFTYTCEQCGAINRVANTSKTGGKWNCGRCGNTVLYRKAIFHERLITDVRVELDEILTQLKEIKFPLFAQKKIKEIEQKNEKCRSKMENWIDHVAYLKTTEEKEIIFDSYKSDIKIIESKTLLIIEEIQDARWLQEKIASIEIFRKIIVSIGLTMKAMTSIFAFLGLDGLITHVSNFFNAKLLEHIHD